MRRFCSLASRASPFETEQHCQTKLRVQKSAKVKSLTSPFARNPAASPTGKNFKDPNLNPISITSAAVPKQNPRLHSKPIDH